MKIKSLLSACVLLLFAILAGGSLDVDLSIGLWIIGVIGGVVVLVIIGFMIQASVMSHNQEKRIEMIRQDEAENTDFDRSVNFGNDRCKFYFDSSKKQVMIMRVMTEGIKKVIVNDFEFSNNELCRQDDPYFCIYDNKNRKILSGAYEQMTPTYSVKDIASEDHYNDIVSQCNITPIIVSYSTAKFEIIYTLIDQSHGLMAIIRKGNVSSVFNYVNRLSLLQKTDLQPSVSNKGLGNYHFIMDDFFNVLVIVTPSSYEVFNYSDIINVSYEENGTQIYSKSAMRTVGGAIVGGALMGEAGAIVGGLSGDSKEYKEVNKMQVKILLRNTQRTSYVLDFNDSNGVLNTKEITDKKFYETFQQNANQAKDILSVIIDRAQQEATTMKQPMATYGQSAQPGVAEELAKFAKLKEEGFLTDEEFNAQKAKLLDL